MIEDDAAPPAIPLAEAKAFLRLEQDAEDALILGLIDAATGLCEGFTGQALVARSVTESVAADGCWQRLARAPVRSIAAPGCEISIDAGGIGWVRAPHGAAPVSVTYEAGLAADADRLPEPIRQGVARLAAYLFANRDGADAPPAAVAALWRPWRRMRLR